MVNFEARKARHDRLEKHPKKQVWKKDLQKKQEQSEEIRFLRRLIVVGIVFFFGYHFLAVIGYETLPTSEAMVQEFIPQKLALSEEGFLIKPTRQAVSSDFSKLTDALEYTIESGDTLSGLAARFGLKEQTILQNNTIPNKHRLKVGDKLIIPPVDGIRHIVAKNEKIADIAKKYRVKEEAILNQNGLNKENLTLAEGRKLIIPGAIKVISRYTTTKGYYAPGTITGLKYVGPVGGTLIKPAAGKLTQGFRRGHYALDIGNRKKGPIFASANGKVTKAQCGWNGGYGCMILVDHENGLQTLYAHNEKLYVKVGDSVTQGQTIAWMGNTGRVRGVTGIHVHFEVIENGIKKNPWKYF